MPGKEFFARMAPEFAQHAGSARESETRQGELERLIATAEYECYQLRRELVGVMGGIAVVTPSRATGPIDSGEGVVHGGDGQPAEAA